MTEQEIKKYKHNVPQDFIIKIKDHREEDQFGIYETGIYNYQGMKVVVAVEDGMWHLSVSAKFPLGYQQLKKLRYMFLPNNVCIAQIFPPREEFVNVFENCWHLWQIRDNHNNDAQL